MPLYEYECESCAQRFERIQKFSDPPVEACPSCNGRVRKLLSSPAIQFKGSGFYITDYAKKSYTEDKKAGSADASKADTAKTESASPAADSSSSSGSPSGSGSSSGSSSSSSSTPSTPTTTKSE
jgi:putative FmdB family regulatory protein